MGRVVGTALAIALALMLLVSSCGTSEADGTVARARPAEAVRLIAAGDHTVVDLRSPSAFRAGHVAGARNIDADAPGFEDRVRALDEHAAYVVYARSKAQSAPAAEEMVRLGVDRVVDAGGFGMLALAGADLEG